MNESKVTIKFTRSVTAREGFEVSATEQATSEDVSTAMAMATEARVQAMAVIGRFLCAGDCGREVDHPAARCLECATEATRAEVLA